MKNQIVLCIPFLILKFLFVWSYEIPRPLYWRDYNGTIPSNVFVASNVSGTIKYIGRALVDGGITVVTIQEGDTTVYGPMNGVKKATVNETIIEILCDGYLNARWDAMKVSQYKQFGKGMFVIGGKEFKKKENVYYVGKYRNKETKEESLGKIIDGGKFCYVMPGNQKTACLPDDQYYFYVHHIFEK